MSGPVGPVRHGDHMNPQDPDAGEPFAADEMPAVVLPVDDWVTVCAYLVASRSPEAADLMARISRQVTL